MKEERIWKKIPGVVGYEFSNLGEIKCLPKRANHYLTVITKGSVDSRGWYYVFMIREEGFKQQWKVHRLIGLAHKPNPLNLPCINHLDNNGLNNHIDNLQCMKFSKHSSYENSKINIDIANYIRWVYKIGEVTQKNLETIFGISDSLINDILLNKRYI